MTPNYKDCLMFKIDPEIASVIIVLIVSLISGLNSLVIKMKQGYKFSVLWFISEYSMCILFGFLAFDVYPTIKVYLWEWMTVWIFVAVAAHIGGRFIQIIERITRIKYGFTEQDSPIPPCEEDERNQ